MKSACPIWKTYFQEGSGKTVAPKDENRSRETQGLSSFYFLNTKIRGECACNESMRKTLVATQAAKEISKLLNFTHIVMICGTLLSPHPEQDNVVTFVTVCY